ncbi:MAG: hypothetical protein RLZZ501_163, partial [Pseudomonadota bacterium]
WAGQDEFSVAAIGGMFAAIPFAIWFFLAIEGAAMAAEETRNPSRTVPVAYIAGILTLVVLAFGTMIMAGGVGDWSTLANVNDPLPQAMKIVVGADSGWLHMLVFIGLFGLIASFHGIIMGYSRQIFALARAGFLPPAFAVLNPTTKTPIKAILAGGVVGIAAIFSDELIQIGGQPLTANIVTMSAFGALVMYILSMAALFKLRRSEPTHARPLAAPFNPLFPAIALGTAALALVTMIYFNTMVFGLFCALFVLGAVFYRFTASLRDNAESDSLLAGNSFDAANLEARTLAD